MCKGSDDLFVRSSRGSHIHLSQNISGRLGYTVNLVSYSLLIDFITDFFRNGVTMIGYHMSHTSKCVLKYGMKHLDIILKLESLAQCLRRVNHQHFQHQQKQCFLLHFLCFKASCTGDRWYFQGFTCKRIEQI